MQEELKNLLIRYRNRIPIEDLYGNSVIILFNEDKLDILTKMKKFSKSNHCKLDEPIVTRYPMDEEFYQKLKSLAKLTGSKKPIPKAIVDKVTHKFNVLSFMQYGIERGFDWVMFTKDEWESVQPKKKKRLIKPKRR